MIRVETATRDDLTEISAVQREAFGRIAAELNIDPGQMPPLQESVEDLARLFDQGARFFIARTADGLVAGTVRAVESDGVVQIGRLAVLGSHTRKGIASALMGAVEQSFPSAVRFELFTGAEATGPLALYAKLGYGITRSEDHDHARLVWLSKDVAPADPEVS